MKVLMLNPPFLPKFSRFSRSPAVTKSGTLYYPIWHGYATGWLEKNGYDVKLVDAVADDLSREDCVKIVKDYEPDMVVTYTSTPSIYNDVEVASLLKEARPEALAVLSGTHSTSLPEETLRLDKNIDVIARKEYDETLVELARKFEEGPLTSEVLSTIDGIAFLDEEEKFVQTKDRANMEDLDAFPFLADVFKRHLTIENYFYAHCRYPIMSIFTSRGCYAKCNFCVYPDQMFGRVHRQRSPQNIVDEFLYIQKELPQVKEVLIDDDTFSVRPAHTQEFSELMIKHGVKVPWTAECRANLTKKTMEYMKKAGCRLIVVGFESADDQVLKNMLKGMSFKRMKKFVDEAREADILVHACFMAGNIGETKETLEKSLEFAKEVNADTCQFFPMMVYPGTGAYTWAKENGYLRSTNFRDWLDEEGLHNCVIDLPDLTGEELVAFCDRARREYYLSPKFLSYKLKYVLKNPKEIKKTAMAARTFAKHLLFPTPQKPSTSSAPPQPAP